VADFIREVDEDYRRDKTIAFWKTYGWMFAVGAVAIVLAAAGYTYYESTKQKALEAQATAYLRAEQLVEKERISDAITQLEALLGQEPSPGYTALSQIRLAQLDLAEGDSLTATRRYEAVAQDANLPQTFRDLAQVASTSLQLDKMTSDTAIERLSALTLDSDYRYTASELIGVSLLREGKKAEALPYFRTVAQAQEAPQSMRARAKTLLDALEDEELPDISAALTEEAPTPGQTDSGAGEVAP